MRVDVVHGSIFQQGDAQAALISTQANLRMGSGVAGAMHRMAGSALADYCRAYAPIATSQALLTPGFGAPYPWLIHARASSYVVSKDAHLHLHQALLAAMQLAHGAHLHRLVMPAIGTGSFQFPPMLAARITAQSLKSLQEADAAPDWIRICVARTDLLAVYRSALAGVGYG